MNQKVFEEEYNGIRSTFEAICSHPEWTGDVANNYKVDFCNALLDEIQVFPWNESLTYALEESVRSQDNQKNLRLALNAGVGGPTLPHISLPSTSSTKCLMSARAILVELLKGNYAMATALCGEFCAQRAFHEGGSNQAFENAKGRVSKLFLLPTRRFPPAIQALL